MRVLVACEFSGVVRDAFIRAGHDAMSADLRESLSPDGPHHHGDALDVLDHGWDLIIAHPPCTYLANSGVQHLHTKPERWDQMRDGDQTNRPMAPWTAATHRHRGRASGHHGTPPERPDARMVGRRQMGRGRPLNHTYRDRGSHGHTVGRAAMRIRTGNP